MKKVIATAAGILFAVFGIAILGLLMSLTFGALGKLFPGNFMNQIWGLVLFDIAAMIWALAFVFKCQSTTQYAVAAIGFIAAFVGTLGMVAVEVLLGGQTYVQVSDWVGQWLVYGYVLMTALHSALLYAHHAAAPDIHEKINVGIARGEIVTEAIKQATQSLEVQKAALAESIHNDIVAQVKRDLGIQRGQVLDLPALPVTDPQSTETKQQPAFNLFGLPVNWWAKKNGNKTYEAVAPMVTTATQATEQGKAAEAGTTPPAPFRDGPAA
jgi:apolipoprotein N-acyltransferase